MLSLLTDDEVRDGEGEEEVVGDGLQLLVHLEADHHHEVPGDGDEGERPGRGADQRLLPRLVPFRHRTTRRP